MFQEIFCGVFGWHKWELRGDTTTGKVLDVCAHCDVCRYADPQPPKKEDADDDTRLDPHPPGTLLHRVIRRDQGVATEYSNSPYKPPWTREQAETFMADLNGEGWRVQAYHIDEEGDVAKGPAPALDKAATLTAAASSLVGGLHAMGGPLDISAANEITRLWIENDRLNELRTHCEDCGGDYMVTGVECRCPCKLIEENTELREAMQIFHDFGNFQHLYRTHDRDEVAKGREILRRLQHVNEGV